MAQRQALEASADPTRSLRLLCDFLDDSTGPRQWPDFRHDPWLQRGDPVSVASVADGQYFN